MEIIRNIVCQVLYQKKKSRKIIHSVLNEFIPNYKEIHKDCDKPDDENYEFKSENELIEYYGETTNLRRTLYWNKEENNPYNIMVGVNITSDDKIVFSITLDGTLDDESSYYIKLKRFLDSDIGVISYVDPVFYASGQEFYEKYKEIKYEFEKL